MPTDQTPLTYVERDGQTFAVGRLTGVAYGGVGDDIRFTTRVVRTLPTQARLVAARAFVGFICRVTIEDCGMKGEHELAVEGVAFTHSGATADLLIVTRPPNTHDLSAMEAYSLATVRSIETIRRF